MSKRKAYPIELLLKIKQVNPNYQFAGEDLRVYEEFLEKEAELSLMNTLEEKPKKVKKAKQQLQPTDTESIEEVSFETNFVPNDFIGNEANEETSTK